MPTPLVDCLRRFADEQPLRFNMPGHHGNPLPAGELASVTLDFTETFRTGDLFGDGGDAVEEAERLWARACGFRSCLFLTGGSTQGVHTGLAMLAGSGGEILLDRSAHRSAFHALALLDLTPRYLLRPWLAGEGVSGAVEPAEVERMLCAHPKVKTVCIVSPTYYGVLSDIPAIARVCHEHNAVLLVDGAHGAHLPFLGYEGYRAADMVVISAHKTLPALGQAALLLSNGYSMDDLRRFGSVYGSSSPSYLLMASIDLARDWMEGEGGARYRRVAGAVRALRDRLPCVKPRRGLELDPTRLTFLCADGFAAAKTLEGQGIIPEMADRNHVVFILTGADTDQGLDRLSAALQTLSAQSPPPEDFSGLAPPGPPEQVLSPREALFRPAQKRSLWSSEGWIAASQIAPYPPGVPVVAPGERLTKPHLAYLRKIGYNTNVYLTPP